MTKDEAVMTDLADLTGTWRVVWAVRDGKKLSDAEIEGIALTIEPTGRVWVKQKGQTFLEGTLTIDPTKNPKREDATQTSEGENKGKTVLSIYEIDGDTLRICSAAGPGKALAKLDENFRLLLVRPRGNRRKGCHRQSCLI